MSSRTQVISLHDHNVSRASLAGFLNAAWPETSLGAWSQRLNYWWEKNPFRKSDSHQGFLALSDEQIVGFGGFIPAQFAWQGNPVQGLYATSFRVEEQYSKAAATMFLQQRELMKTNVIVHSTPLPRIQTTLLKLGGRGETHLTCHYIALGGLSCFNGTRQWPVLDSTMKLATSLNDVMALARNYQKADRLEKWTTVESLRWYCESPMRQHQFVGAVDSKGMLTSFLMLALRRRRGIATWNVVETFTTRESSDELLALIGSLVHEPGLLPGRSRLLTVSDFDDDPALASMPAILRRQEDVCHYYLMPEELRNVPKHTVLAEGDLGL